jgi:hypothetical protein
MARRSGIPCGIRGSEGAVCLGCLVVPNHPCCIRARNDRDHTGRDRTELRNRGQACAQPLARYLKLWSGLRIAGLMVHRRRRSPVRPRRDLHSRRIGCKTMVFGYPPGTSRLPARRSTSRTPAPSSQSLQQYWAVVCHKRPLATMPTSQPNALAIAAMSQ